MENSQNLPPKGKHNTTKTSKLIPEAALEILTQSFKLVEEAGVTLEVSVTGDGVTAEKSVTVVIHKTDFINGVLVPLPP